MPDSENDTKLTRDDAINQIIVSIAMEEIALSHIINTEGEKLQYVLGTLEGIAGPIDAATIEELLALNKSVRETLDSAAQNQMLLKNKLQSALNASVLQGPTGPTGPAGPAGTEGPQGIQGIAGTVGTIKGSFDTEEELRAAHAEGEPGDFYYVKPDLFVWDEEKNDWINVGEIAGPQGIQGIQGQKGDIGPAGPQGQKGDIGPAGPQGQKGETGPAGPQGQKGETGPAGQQGPEASSYTIIPFASQMAPRTYANSSGNPTRVTLLGFSYFYTGGDITFVPDTSILLAADGSFQLTSANSAANRQLVFSLPFDMKLNSIYITVGNYGLFTPTGAVFPYVQLYSAEPGSNTFRPITNALAIPSGGIGPGIIGADEMRSASVINLNTELPAGTRIAIGGLMKITGDFLPRDYYLYFTGGIGMTRWDRG